MGISVPGKASRREGPFKPDHYRTRAWEPGKLPIFDDTIEHEAWNDSDRDRVILIFDIWRPELSLDERRAVTAIFEAIDG
jgi:aspartyl/asparaginyl beta-hydroxylase (cupin superfamily)